MKKRYGLLAFLLLGSISVFANDVVIKNNTTCPFSVVLNSGTSVFVPPGYYTPPISGSFVVTSAQVTCVNFGSVTVSTTTTTGSAQSCKAGNFTVHWVPIASGNVVVQIDF